MKDLLRFCVTSSVFLVPLLLGIMAVTQDSAYTWFLLANSLVVLMWYLDWRWSTVAVFDELQTSLPTDKR